VRFEVLMVASMKMAVFCVVVLCTDISEVLAASIIRVMSLHGATTQKTAIFMLATVRT
jgi:hypothetical protein